MAKRLNFVKIVTGLVALVLCLFAAPQLESRADGDELRLENGVLSWDPVDNAVSYDITVALGAYFGFSEVTSDTSYDLEATMRQNENCPSCPKNRYYAVFVRAYSATDVMLKEMYMPYRGYQATMPQLESTVPRFNGTSVTWEKVEHAKQYVVTLSIGVTDACTDSYKKYFPGTNSIDISKDVEAGLYYKATVYAIAGGNGYISADSVTTDAVKGKDLINGYVTPLKFEGSVTVDNEYPKTGDTIRATLSGISKSIPTSSISYEWQVQTKVSDGYSVFETRKNSADPTFTVQSGDAFIRLIVRAEGCQGTITTDDIRVVDGVLLDKTTFPDATFRSYLKDNYDKDRDGILSDSEIKNISVLMIGQKGITSLKGIEYLSNLENVYAYQNDLTEADFSGLRYLWVLDVSENENLTSLNLSGCSMLHNLYIQDTALTGVDISGSPDLRELDSYRNKVYTLDIRNNPGLLDAALYGEKKTGYTFENLYDWYQSEQNDLKIAASTTLQLVSLDEKHFPSSAFRQIVADGFDWNTDGILSDTEAKAVEILCPEDEEDKIQTLQGVEYFPNLVHLSAFNCRIRYINLRYNSKLTHLDLGGNRIQSLSLSDNPNLEYFDISNNPKLATLSLAGCPKLDFLGCSGCNLTELDLSNNTALADVDCSDNPITSLDVSKNTKLMRLRVDGCKLSKLDIRKNAKLKSAYSGTKEKRKGTAGQVYYHYTSKANNLCYMNVDSSTQVISSQKNLSSCTVTSPVQRVYSGSALKPAVTIKDGTKTLKSGTDYTVAYSNNINVGKATMKITGKGSYTGTVTKSFKIIPKGTSLKKVTGAAGSFTVTWNKQTEKMKTENITGYQIQYNTDKKFASNNKVSTVKGYTRAGTAVKGLVSGKTYYVRIRTYTKVNGVNYFSVWSDAKTVKVK